MSNQKRIPWVLYVIVLVVAGLLATLHFNGGVNEYSLRMMTRHTARFSFMIFIITFTASSLVAFYPGKALKYVLRNRRYFGLSFALAHTIHLGAIVSFISLTEHEVQLPAILFGGTGYLFIALMALTSNNQSMRALGRNWKRLHTVGGYLILFGFAQTYLSRITFRPLEITAKPSPIFFYQFFFGVCILALGLRLWHLYYRRTSQMRINLHPQP